MRVCTSCPCARGWTTKRRGQLWRPGLVRARPLPAAPVTRGLVRTADSAGWAHAHVHDTQLALPSQPGVGGSPPGCSGEDHRGVPPSSLSPSSQVALTRGGVRLSCSLLCFLVLISRGRGASSLLPVRGQEAFPALGHQSQALSMAVTTDGFTCDCRDQTVRKYPGCHHPPCGRGN